MESVTRGAFGLAFLLLLAGVASVAVPLPQSAALEPGAALDALSAAVSNPLVLAAGLACLGLLVGARLRGRAILAALPRAAATLPALPPGAGGVEGTAFALAQLRERVGRDAPRGVDAVALVELLVHGAIQSQASDIHIHPLEDGSHLALRVHGTLEEIAVVPRAQHGHIVNRLKVLTKVVTFLSDRPQDGHFSQHTPDGDAELRTSFLPTQHGEKIVMRVARPGLTLPELSSLGMGPQLQGRVEALLSKPQGMIFFTGPTGSGKTTSIYASLGHINRSRGAMTQIATIEDPIEFNVPALAQTQVNNASGLSFAQGLRALLRQDPNVLMVGEIRDVETARIAVQAGLTGHLILTTVHANSSAGVFNRLLEMEVEPFVLASVSLACISQRLVRTLCVHCRKSEEPSAQEAERLRAAGLRVTPFSVAVGCEKCAGLGFTGRTAIHEVLIVSTAIRELIQARVSTEKLLEAAYAEGTVPLFTAAVESARAGVTTLAEALRVAG